MSLPKLERLLILMAQKKASDLYLSADAPIMIRLDGHLVPVNSEQKLTSEEIYTQLKNILSDDDLKTLESTYELNTAIHLSGIGNFRFSCFKQRGSFSIVVRFIPLKIPSFESLHLPIRLADVALLKRGLVLFVGATGSGKSTSIASLLDLRNSHIPGHILTVEDPIEYYFTNKCCIINQREVGKDTRSLNIALKNALRQMPDCIFIGEIRDVETMSAALSYAQSGHLCISTLHANNAYEALNRILSFYPEQNRPLLFSDLAASLKVIISQRLIPTTKGDLYPAVEVLENTRLISELITKGDFNGIHDAMEKSLAEGCQTFEDDLINMIGQNLITTADAMTYSDSPSNLMWRLQNSPSTSHLSASGAKKAISRSGSDINADENIDIDDTPTFSDIILK